MRPRLQHVVVASLLFAGAPALADGGASTFESAQKLYRHREIRLEDIPVPKVQVKPEQKAAPEAQGLAFEIRSFAVVGSTLLAPADVEKLLAPYVGKDKHMADIQAARDQLQHAYETEGLPTAIVTVPQQTVANGRVRLEVVEARLGKVAIENPGIHWYSDDRLRDETPSLQPGAVIRSGDLEQDLTRANRSPDRRVTPVLKAGSELGTVDLDLQVDDRIPLHAEAEWNNFYTAGTPQSRANVRLTYDNLFDLDHQIGLSYQFVPQTGSAFHEVQVWTVTYALPAPWRPDQDHVFAYGAWSDTSSLLPTQSGINALGNGFTGGLRYDFGLPTPPGLEHFAHYLTLGVDYKHIENTLAQPDADPPIPAIVTPIRYLPFDVGYTAQQITPNTFSQLRFALGFDFAGIFDNQGTKEDFQANRGGISQKNDVTGDYQIYKLTLGTTLRAGPLFQTLAQGRFLDLPPGERPLQDDWSLFLQADGQYASEPLISTEQYPLGGYDSVRGYLEGEAFGDHGWTVQTELRSRRFSDWLQGWLNESAQGFAFYHVGEVLLLGTGTEGRGTGVIQHEQLMSAGVGLRAALASWLEGEASVGLPFDGTGNTGRYDPHFNFRLRSRF